jgi:hypothetical protein
MTLSPPKNSETEVTIFLIIAQTRLSEVLSQLPIADLAFQDPKIGHKLQCADSTFFTAKSAFLPAEKSKNSSTTAQYFI